MKHWFASLSKRPEVPAIRLVALISAWFLLFLNCSFWRFVWERTEIAHFSDVLFLLSVPLVIFTILYLAVSLLLVPYIGKPILIILLIISGGTNYLMYEFGVFIDVDMIRNTFQTHPGEVKDLISLRGVLWLMLGGILPAMLLAWVKIRFRPFVKEATGRLARCGILLLCLLLLAPFVYKGYSSFCRNNRQFRRLINPQNYLYATFRYFQQEAQGQRKFTKLDDNAHLTPEAANSKKVFVLVLGETARAMNFATNGYERDTNPKLKQQDIVNFKNVLAAGTSTAVSVPSIFSFKPAKNFDASDAKYTENLLDLLQQTGYQVLWKENDNGCKGVCNRVPTIEMDLQDERFCNGSYCQDEILLQDLEKYIRQSDGSVFIVLHTIGSHGPTYYLRYPPEFKRFTPTCDTKEIQTCTQEQIRNTYDNTILYTDYIAASVIEILKKFPQYETGMMYVSDHGESLGEKGLYLHGLPYFIAPHEQTDVPMIIWLNNAMQKADHINYACLKKKAAEDAFSHDYIAHSLLSLMGVESVVYDKTFDFFDGCRTAPISGKRQ